MKMWWPGLRALGAMDWAIGPEDRGRELDLLTAPPVQFNYYEGSICRVEVAAINLQREEVWMKSRNSVI